VIRAALVAVLAVVASLGGMLQDDAGCAPAREGADAMPFDTGSRPLGSWRVEGRYVPTVDGPRLTWAGSSLAFRFLGKSVDLTYVDDTVYTDANSDWYDVSIDGVWQTKRQLPGTTLQVHDMLEHTWTITAAAPGLHDVVLLKRTEESSGTTLFKRWSSPLYALDPDTRTRKIEFVGDSLTAGYGIEWTTGANSAAFANERLSHTAIVAARFGAERHTIACSGRGLVQDATGDTSYAGNMVDRWLRRQESAAHPDYLTPWDFSTWQADVVTVNLGTNDYTHGPIPIRDAFASFYRLIRTKYANAYIIGILGSQLTGTNRSDLRTQIQGAIADVGRLKISFLEMPNADPADGVGGDGHPSPATHAKQAALLVAQIQAVTGWP
jgi:lysophospholipase L1-like esterase